MFFLITKILRKVRGVDRRIEKARQRSARLRKTSIDVRKLGIINNKLKKYPKNPKLLDTKQKIIMGCRVKFLKLPIEKKN